MPCRTRCFAQLLIVLFAGLATCVAAPPATAGAIRKLTLDADAPVVELFDGIEGEQLEVRVSARDEFEAKVFITNTTGETITVVVPAAVAAVPVLAQLPFGPNQLNNNSNSQNQSNADSQRIGGQFSPSGNPASGFPQFQNQNAQNGNGPGFFSIPAEKTVQIELHTVCLDHGKSPPHPKLSYELRRLDEEVPDAVLRALLATFDPRDTDRLGVQAAVWHLSNGMDWEELKNKSRTFATPPQKFFSRRQIEAAQKLVERATDAVRKAGETTVVKRRL